MVANIFNGRSNLYRPSGIGVWDIAGRDGLFVSLVAPRATTASSESCSACKPEVTGNSRCEPGLPICCESSLFSTRRCYCLPHHADSMPMPLPSLPLCPLPTASALVDPALLN